MAEAFTFELVSPERLLVSEAVESVVIPGTEGENRFGHDPLQRNVAEVFS